MEYVLGVVALLVAVWALISASHAQHELDRFVCDAMSLEARVQATAVRLDHTQRCLDDTQRIVVELEERVQELEDFAEGGTLGVMPDVIRTTSAKRPEVRAIEEEKP